MNRFIYLLSLVLLFSCSSFNADNYRTISSVDEQIQLRPNLSFYHYAQTMFFSKDDQRRFGIEIEFGGLDSKQSAELIQKNFGGVLETEDRWINIGIKEVKGNGEVIYEQTRLDDYVVKGSSLGDMKIITEFNEESSVVDFSKVNPVTEVISPPVRADKIEDLQRMANLLKDAGATGTMKGQPVGIHVTAEINEGIITDDVSGFVVDLLRNLSNSKNIKENRHSLNIPEERQKYLASYSNGFKKKLSNPKYNPTMDELYDDFIYRQTLERMNIPDSSRAWSASIKDVRKIVTSQSNQLIPEVVKFQPVKVTSLLIKARPKDHMSKLYYDIEEWIKPGPVIEFREANNDFNLAGAIKRTLGTINLTEQYGAIDDIDKFVSEISNVDTKTIKEMRQLVKNDPDRPYLYRYMISDQSIESDPDMEYLVDIYKEKNDVVIGHLPEEKYGIKPLVLPGESVVFHRRPHHRHSIIGKYNPGIINYNIAQTIEHKYLEYRFWEDYASGSMPRTKLLRDVIAQESDPVKMVKLMNEAFPEGWIMKGVFDLATEKHLVTDDLDIANEIINYKNSNFDQIYAKAKSELVGADIEELVEVTKNHPNYFGWKLSQFFDKPHEVIIQQKVKIATEFRVEVLGGKVLGQGSTIDRYAYMGEGKSKGMPSSAPERKVLVEKIESHTQKIIDQLPDEFRSMTFAMDIALLEDGTFTMIESNPGGNSGFLALEDRSVQVLNDFLRSYPDKVKAGDINQGLSGKEQIDFLLSKFDEWGIKVSEIPDLTFASDHIVDKEFTPVKLQKYKNIKRSYWSHEGAKSCKKLIAPFLAN